MASVSSSESGLLSGERHYGEVSMESFIRHQMTVILQPLSEQVQELDEQMSQLLDGLRKTDDNVANLHRSLDGNVTEVAKLRDDLGRTNSNVSKAKQALLEAGDR